MLNELKNGRKVVGAKQTRRALGDGSAQRVYLAMDADPRVVEPVETMCRERGVPVERVERMKDLGSACGIAVGSAVAALLR
ncbi:MAG TPA: ribosomal L7Ae/L30e/S12e/Gadd45 family protein [Candidatus Flavonifractor intestinipullorum]|uniref:Ribosomal L7Ae/L30e/S12e/Gadd45 family protein n=1 Tax=Candidatus Flavonifractor intestinipullorum TaxID=2838587 RepID=A0A9D2MB33_9FIRM|nr:ribosomal L7Ae/L30e/S12e/Gadd45 family protein [Candidatus Flavonifractor intestinipullorum]